MTDPASNDRVLRFGLYDLMEHRPGVPLGDLYRDRFELLRFADDAGLWSYHTTEHHLNPVDATPSPNVFLAAAAQHTEHIRLCTLVNVIPMYHPIRLAEELIMVDHLSNGRLEIGVGKGVSPVELQIMGHHPEEAHERFDEDLACLLDIFTTEKAGGAPLPALPVQRPYPPLWYAGNADYAGRRNLNVVIGGPVERVIERAELHRRLVRERPEPELLLNPTIERPLIAASRHVFVGPDGPESRRRAVRAWSAYHDNIRAHFRRTDTPAASNPTLDGDGNVAIAGGALVAGTADEVAHALASLASGADVDELIGSFCWGDLSHDEAMGSLGRYVEEVIPQVRDIHAERRATG